MMYLLLTWICRADGFGTLTSTISSNLKHHREVTMTFIRTRAESKRTATVSVQNKTRNHIIVAVQTCRYAAGWVCRRRDPSHVRRGSRPGDSHPPDGTAGADVLPVTRTSLALRVYQIDGDLVLVIPTSGAPRQGTHTGMGLRHVSEHQLEQRFFFTARWNWSTKVYAREGSLLTLTGKSLEK